MTRDARYPLEAVETLRAHAEDTAGRTLAEALRRLEARAQERSRARAALVAHRRARRAGHEDAKRTTGLEWTRNQAYRERQAEREATLEAALRSAARAENAARDEVAQARRGLGGAAARRAVVQAHRERWQAEAAQEAERREER